LRSTAIAGLETKDGHALHFDEDGAVIGATLVNVGWTLKRHGEIALTWPSEHLDAKSGSRSARRCTTRPTWSNGCCSTRSPWWPSSRRI